MTTLETDARYATSLPLRDRRLMIPVRMVDGRCFVAEMRRDGINRVSRWQIQCLRCIVNWHDVIDPNTKSSIQLSNRRDEPAWARRYRYIRQRFEPVLMSLTDSQNSCIVINTNHHHGLHADGRNSSRAMSRKSRSNSHVTIHFLLLKIEASAKRKK